MAPRPRDNHDFTVPTATPASRAISSIGRSRIGRFSTVTTRKVSIATASTASQLRRLGTARYGFGKGVTEPAGHRWVHPAERDAAQKAVRSAVEEFDNL